MKVTKPSPWGLRIIAYTVGLAIVACLLADPSLAADPAAFDGIYTGSFATVSGGGYGSGPNGWNCEENKLEQKMLISGGQVYLDRKFNNPNIRLLLSGTVSPEGSVSAAGATVVQSPQYMPAGAHLSGTIQGDEFSGQLAFRGCQFSVQLRKTS
jgi:hypothetical protein